MTLANGTVDLQPGVQIAYPLIPEADYVRLTDHLPVVLNLRVSAAPPPPAPQGGLRIVGLLPNPVTDDAQDEEVHLFNSGGSAGPLTGWILRDDDNTECVLDASDGPAQPAATVIVRRRGRGMWLSNSGNTVMLIDPNGAEVDRKTYGNASSGTVFHFN